MSRNTDVVLGKGNALAPVEGEPYQKTEREHAQGLAWLTRSHSQPILPRIKLDDGHRIVFDHPDAGVATILMLEALGLSHSHELNELLNRITELTAENGAPSEIMINRSLAFVADLHPRNALEAMLAVQMVAIHNATLVQAKRLRTGAGIEQMEANGNLFSKLARTFALQAEAMKKLRSAGEQKVIVEHRHYHVHPGGQAVFGDVTTGRSSATEIEDPGDERVRVPERGPVQREGKTLGRALPLPGGEGLGRVPGARRTRRRA